MTLLEASIFHGSHIHGLAEASTEYYKAHVLDGAGEVSAAATPAQAPRPKADKRNTDKQSLTSYHWQLFQVTMSARLEKTILHRDSQKYWQSAC